MVDHSELERAYQDAVVGSNPPSLVVTSGRLILEHRPDLLGAIDPSKAYYVTAESIVEVEVDA